LNYFHANDIEMVWVFDGGFNPAKNEEQRRRRSVGVLLAVDMNNKIMARIKRSDSRHVSCIRRCIGLPRSIRPPLSRLMSTLTVKWAG
jgi:hypothetical protein